MTTNKEQQEAEYYLVNVYKPNQRPKLAGKPSVKNSTELGGYLFWLMADSYQFDVIPLTARAKLTSQVASGEAVGEVYSVPRADGDGLVYTYYGMTKYDNAKIKDGDRLYLHPPTPSPSNVLVEALRKIVDGRYKQRNAMTDTEMADIAREALATYSSTDSVSVPRDVDTIALESSRNIMREINSMTAHVDISRVGQLQAKIQCAIIAAIDTARKSS